MSTTETLSKLSGPPKTKLTTTDCQKQDEDHKYHCMRLHTPIERFCSLFTCAASVLYALHMLGRQRCLDFRSQNIAPVNKENVYFGQKMDEQIQVDSCFVYFVNLTTQN
ncbi:hypothetical protein Adt_22925 [Abeliophyllum distichum]|uniref:Uncharacterized protein n=1 Tax=Abeliophyllum distichum TaxID=126358 RepID=A0ABD1S9L2_9LAMI